MVFYILYNMLSDFFFTVTMRYIVSLVIFLTCFFTCQAFAESYTVTKVYSGNLVKIQTGAKVQYIGLDAPGEARFFYDECKKANKDLVDKKEMKIR